MMQTFVVVLRGPNNNRRIVSFQANGWNHLTVLVRKYVAVVFGPDAEEWKPITMREHRGLTALSTVDENELDRTLLRRAEVERLKVLTPPELKALADFLAVYPKLKVTVVDVAEHAVWVHLVSPVENLRRTSVALKLSPHPNRCYARVFDEQLDGNQWVLVAEHTGSYWPTLRSWNLYEEEV